MSEMTPMPIDRRGYTHKLCVGTVSIYVTVNRDSEGAIREMFAKADDGYQPEADGLSLMASLAMRFGAPPEVVARHLRHRRYPPRGGPGQPCSISDALAIALEREIEKDKPKGT